MTSTEVARLNSRALDMVRDQLAPDASPEELEWFAAVAKHLQLDPFRGHIVLIGRRDARLKRTVHRPQITVDGRLALAERTGELDGIEGPVWCGPREQWGGELVWHDVWLDDQNPPYCARVLVFRKGRRAPTANGTAKWSEFAQTVPVWRGEEIVGRKLTPTWEAMPSHMLGKVALSMALRRAFSDVIDVAVESEFDGFDAEAEPGPTVPSTAHTEAAGPSSGEGSGAEESVTTTAPGPDSPHEFIVPTGEQYDAMRAQRARLGLDGRDHDATWRALLSNLLGRDIARTADLSRPDVAELLTKLEEAT